MNYEFTLCAGRHDTPAKDSIFPEGIDPMDFQSLIETANNAIPNNAKYLKVYVTGLTPAMLAVVRVCEFRGISLTAMHYNRDTGEYCNQTVLQFTPCPFCHNGVPDGATACPTCGAT